MPLLPRFSWAQSQPVAFLVLVAEGDKPDSKRSNGIRKNWTQCGFRVPRGDGREVEDSPFGAEDSKAVEEAREKDTMRIIGAVRIKELGARVKGPQGRSPVSLLRFRVRRWRDQGRG